VGAWLMNGDNGNEVTDISGRNHHGQVIGAAEWTEGVFGNAFESAGSRVEVPHHDDFVTPTFTLMAWINVDVIPNDWGMTILAKDQWPNRNYAMYVAQNAGTVHFAFGTAAQQDVGNFNGKTLIADGEWHHAVMTYDLEMRRIYVDGVLDGEQPSNAQPGNPGSPVLIGRVTGGLIDEVLIANEALEAADIAPAYANGLEGMLGFLSVSSGDKMATTWGSLKSR
ncbi:MAG: LamG domain-containing protein, partial [Candidatus Poribacteria bacterium]|nr:LamG domain-containing protein [Candidatus Poribacteria bacterium]